MSSEKINQIKKGIESIEKEIENLKKEEESKKAKVEAEMKIQLEQMENNEGKKLKDAVAVAKIKSDNLIAAQAALVKAKDEDKIASQNMKVAEKELATKKSAIEGNLKNGVKQISAEISKAIKEKENEIKAKKKEQAAEEKLMNAPK
jgi:hypothetical protein